MQGARQDSRSEQSDALVVAVDVGMRLQIKAALAAESLDVTACERASAALAALPSLVPTVVVIDDSLGLDSAAELCRSIRANPKCRFVPIILLSEEDGRDALHGAYDNGFTTVFVKPVSDDFLRSRFRSYSDTGRTISGLHTMPALEPPPGVPDVFLELSASGAVRQWLGGPESHGWLSRDRFESGTGGEPWPPEIAATIRREVRRALTTREGHAFEVSVEQAGKTVPYEIRLLVQGRDRLLAIVRDIRDFPLAGLARQSSNADTLTGLTRREIFMRELDELVDAARLRERSVAVICIDLDNFSAINDSFGRATGDAVLRASAERLQRCLRDNDALTSLVDDDTGCVGRTDSNEFVAVLGDITSRETIRTVAERIVAAFDEPVAHDANWVPVRPTLGIAAFPTDAADAETLMLAARNALLQARENGDKQIAFYSETLSFKVLSRFDVGDELRWAIDKQQLDLHYLPRIDLASGSIVALEALLRWEHPLRGTIPSSEILPLAEVTGLMASIGEWVVHAACAHKRRWRDESGQSPTVSINLSSREFGRKDLADIVAAALTENGLDSGSVEFELTEAVLMRQPRALKILNDLKALGTSLVIDNFGMGHSSFLRLAQYPIDAIKIDRHFVQSLDDDSSAGNVCAAIVAVAHKLGFRVVAEGVETDRQLGLLTELACDEAQGFLYSRPVPSADTAGFLNAFAIGNGSPPAARLDLASKASLRV